MDTLSFKLFRNAVREAINRHDPIGLRELGAPDDEYDSEVSTILPRLVQCNDVDEALDAVHSEFEAWFGALTAGRKGKFRELAGELFRLKGEWVDRA
jgi:hypothetical protein